MIVRACAAIMQKRKRILITQRKSDQTFPLKWELPGGHIEPNESRESCLKREIREELGVRITSLKPYCSRRLRIGENTLLIYYYLCRIVKGKLRRLDVADFRWIEPSEHEAYDLVSPDRIVLQKLSKNRVRQRVPTSLVTRTGLL
jgi:8-oxo-dGTP diphosphatase